jgi:galactose mutarotase-like enzyme
MDLFEKLANLTRPNNNFILKADEIKELAANIPVGIFDNAFYDALYVGLVILFPDAKVTPSLKSNTITVKDKINIEFSVSWNEPKVSVRSFITKESIDPDSFHELNKHNYSFRFFDLQTIFNWLYIKVEENTFIRNNEG